MVCDECGKNPATVHLTKIINGKKTEVHLCEECAKKNKEFDSPFSIHQFLAGLMDTTNDEKVRRDYIRESSCNKCEMTYSRFRKTGKFGCNSCYDEFKERLIPLFKKVHGHHTHTGKVPKRTGGMIKIRKEIEKLKKKLNDAVQKEEFEKAAEYRDRIKELEKKKNNN